MNSIVCMLEHRSMLHSQEVCGCLLLCVSGVPVFSQLLCLKCEAGSPGMAMEEFQPWEAAGAGV